jgi:hypothetical protein
MSRFFPNPVRSLTSCFDFVFDLMTDGLRFFPRALCSRAGLSAEILFLRKQLAFYQERQTLPRRLNDSARLSLVFWSRFFDWKDALVIVKPETLIGWHARVSSYSGSGNRGSIGRLCPRTSASSSSRWREITRLGDRLAWRRSCR